MLRMLYIDVWCPIWPNLVSPNIWVIPGFVLHHKLIKRHIVKVMSREDKEDAV